MKLLKILLFLFFLFPCLALAQEDDSFDLSEIEKEVEKQPYGIGGYMEFRPSFLWLDDDAAFYSLTLFTTSVFGFRNFVKSHF